MTHCEKCIHYDMCKAEYDSLDGALLSFFPNNKDCQFFKNKVDFVKVVRCKDCVMCYINSYGKATRLGHCNSRVGLGKTVSFDDFCSYGEKK